MTFAYIDNSLRDRYAKTNPGSTPFAYLDVIVNAMPSHISSGGKSISGVLKNLVAGGKSYAEILRDVDEYQRAVVYGEEDNSGK